MNEKELIKKMVDSVERVPSHAEVFAVRQYSLDDMQQRAKRFLATTAEAFNLPLNRSEWVVQEDRTLLRMPLGARAVVYHASGAMKLVTGLNPMESLFKKVEDREWLVKMVEEAAERLKIREWIGKNESLRFERLWQIKAAAADRKGKVVEPMLCRVVGAYRHFVGKLPVWGAASVAIKLANEGTLDSLTVQMRETTGKVIDRVQILSSDQAARRILLQLSSQMGKSKIAVSEVAAPQWLRFGYLSLPNRKAQRLLAPVYVASIGIERQEESQAYIFVTPATEKAYMQTYMQLLQSGSEAPPTPLRRTD